MMSMVQISFAGFSAAQTAAQEPKNREPTHGRRKNQAGVASGEVSVGTGERSGQQNLSHTCGTHLMKELPL